MITKSNIYNKVGRKVLLPAALLLLSSAVLLTSCDDYVDVVPKGRAIPHTVDDMGKLMNNSFISINGSNFYMVDVCYDVTNVELLSDDYTASDQPGDMYYTMFHDTPAMFNMATWANTIYSAAEQDPTWNGLYKSNYVVNYIINNIDEAAEGYEYQRSEVKGRALVQRALNYFILTNLYGKAYNAATAQSDLGVPLVLQADITVQPARATVAQCYEQMLADVNEAIELLAIDVPEFNFLPGRAAAYALRARINLYMGRFEAALADARQAVSLQPTLLDYNDYYAAYMATCEAVGMQYPYYLVMCGYPGTTRVDNPEVIFLRTNQSFSFMCCPSDEFNKILDYDNDLRCAEFFLYLYGSRPNMMMRTQQSGITTGEMYLTIAEAALCQSSPDVNTAIEALDAVRQKRYLAATYQPTTTTDVQELLQEVIRERRREVSFCVTSFMDKKRWNCDPATAQTMTRTVFGQTYTMAPGDARYALPIPPNVMQLNPNLVDNER